MENLQSILQGQPFQNQNSDLSVPIVYLSFRVYIQVMVKDRGCYYIIVAISLGFSIRTLSNSGLTSLGLQLQDKCRIDNLN